MNTEQTNPNLIHKIELILGIGVVMVTKKLAAFIL